MARTGPSMRGSRLGPVTTTAISMRRSISGSSPVISQSIQMRFWSLLSSVGTASGAASVMGCDCRRKLPPMSPSYLMTLAFAAFLLATLAVKFWLATRQIRHVALHRDSVPAAFEQRVPLPAHQKAADYTVAKTRFGLLETAFGAAVLL